jgi:predicted nucleotidyltransferase
MHSDQSLHRWSNPTQVSSRDPRHGMLVPAVETRTDPDDVREHAMHRVQIEIRSDEIAALCRRWKVDELALFGSVVRGDFRPDSDIDVLVTFAPDAAWSLWDLMDMKEELEALFGREVDLVEKRALRNPFRRHAILSAHEVVYAA